MKRCHNISVVEGEGEAAARRADEIRPLTMMTIVTDALLAAVGGTNCFQGKRLWRTGRMDVIARADNPPCRRRRRCAGRYPGMLLGRGVGASEVREYC